MIERGLIGETRPWTWKIATFLTEIDCISMCVSAAPKLALVPESCYNCNAARLYINTYTKFV